MSDQIIPNNVDSLGGERDDKGRFLPGNRTWPSGLGTDIGKKRFWETPEELLMDAQTYMNWAFENPILEEQVTVTKDGDVVRAEVSHPRALTIQGFCAFFGKGPMAFHHLQWKGNDWEAATSVIKSMFFSHSYEYAAAGLLNPNIVARYLGLADNMNIERDKGDVPRDKPVDLSKLSKQAKKELLRLVTKKDDSDAG